MAEGMKEDKASWEQFIQVHDRARPEGRAGSWSATGAPGSSPPSSEMLPQRQIPAVHGPLHAQRALQGAAHPPRMGVRRAHAHLRQDPLRHRQRLVEPPLPGHVPARRHHAINRLKSFPRRRTRPHLRKTSGTTSPSPEGPFYAFDRCVLSKGGML